MIEKNLQPRLFYPSRLSFRFDGEIFTDKQKLREFSNTKQALQQMLRKLLKAETQEKKKRKAYKNKPKTIKKMIIGT